MNYRTVNEWKGLKPIYLKSNVCNIPEKTKGTYDVLFETNHDSCD